MKIMYGLLVLWLCGSGIFTIGWVALKNNPRRILILGVLSLIYVLACLLFGLYGLWSR